MTLPPVIRIFFAIELPEATKEKIDDLIAMLKKKSKTKVIRWTKRENLHITLQFLAEVQTEHLEQLIAKVRQQVDGEIKHSQISFGSLHLFPNPFRPRVIVLDISPQDELATLAASIGAGIKIMNYPVETRPYRAHLTLGRIKQPQGLDLGFLSEFKSPHLDAVEVNEVVLFRSEPQPEGSKYSVMERISLI